MENLNVVAIGGGTGLSTMLKGLKLHTDNITAIVSVADDGGSSGVLRSDRGMLPPGDVRNCIAALADVEPMYGELLNYRFSDGLLEGHTFGNIFLAAINDMSEDFNDAVKKLCHLVGVKANVVPVSNDSITLNARLSDGTVVVGESNIGKCADAGNRIESVFITPEDASPVKGATEVIEDADIIVMGPGSLYTSIIPNLLVDGIVDAIKKSKAIKVYVCNIMTQPGETEGYTASEHLDAIERHSYRGIVDYMIINDAEIPISEKEAYAALKSEPVIADSDKLAGRVNVMQGNLFLANNGQIRHNFRKTARVIMSLKDNNKG